MSRYINKCTAGNMQWRMCLPAAIILLFPVTSQAYVGPGAGLGMIGSLVAVVVAVLVAIAGLIILPIRLLMKRRKPASEEKQEVMDSNRDEGS